MLTKIDGKYFMYWGEHAVYAATSDDLVNWTPILDEKNELATVIKPRPQYFDSALTECGPPAILTDKGIVLLYNGKNQTNDSKRDKRFTAGAYCAGQLLTDPKEPMKVLQRLDVPFFRPMAFHLKRADSMSMEPSLSKVWSFSKTNGISITDVQILRSA